MYLIHRQYIGCAITSIKDISCERLLQNYDRFPIEYCFTGTVAHVVLAAGHALAAATQIATKHRAAELKRYGAS